MFQQQILPTTSPSRSDGPVRGRTDSGSTCRAPAGRHSPLARLYYPIPWRSWSALGGLMTALGGDWG